ncbi:glycosyltransferase family 39 protein [bacterium]|nr:glycosyltransferase family 39 protein [bacterium]
MRFPLVPLAAVFVVFAFAARAWNLDGAGLNTDELHIAKVAFMPAEGDLTRDVHPPVFPTLVRLVGGALPFSIEAKVRAVSVIAGTLLVGLLAYVGFLAHGSRGAIAASALSFLSPNLLAFSRLGRSYMLFALFGGIAFVLTWHLARRPRRPLALGLAVVNALMLLTFYYAVYVVLAQAVLALVAGRRDPFFRRALLLASGLGVLVASPWFAVAIGQAARAVSGGGWYVWPPTPYEFARRAAQAFAYFSPLAAAGDYAYSFGKITGAAVTAILAAGAWALAFFAARRRGADMFGFALSDRFGTPALGLPAVFVGVVFVLGFLAHVVFGVWVGLIYFACFAAPSMLVVMLALRALSGERVRLAAVGVLLAAQALMLPGVRTMHREDLREAVSLYDHSAVPGAVVLTSAHFVADAFHVYSNREGPFVPLPTGLPGHEDAGRESAAFMTTADRAAFVTVVTGAPEVWLVLSHETRNGVDRGGTLARGWLRQLGFVDMGETSLQGVRWFRYIHPDAATPGPAWGVARRTAGELAA